MSLILAVFSLPLIDMQNLSEALPGQIRLKKMEAALQSKEDVASEEVIKALGIEESKRTKPNGSGRKQDPNGASAQIMNYLHEYYRGTRKEITAFCIKQNQNLTQIKIDAGATDLASKNLITRKYGTWVLNSNL